MSRQQLERAHDLILSEAYTEARELLTPLVQRSSTARRWMAHLDEILGEDETAPEPESPMVDSTPSESVAVVATGPSQPSFAEGEQPGLGEGPTAASGDYSMMTESFTHDGRTRWEYREIVLRNWDQHLSNIEYALEQGSGEKITIEDAYVKLLNENGAQGWEVIAEEILPQQYIRLLMKRPVY
ncbi:MAG: hypothetical protein AAF125_09860 [Chloroflexota bacterium]